MEGAVCHHFSQSTTLPLSPSLLPRLSPILLAWYDDEPEFTCSACRWQMPNVQSEKGHSQLAGAIPYIFRPMGGMLGGNTKEDNNVRADLEREVSDIQIGEKVKR